MTLPHPEHLTMIDQTKAYLSKIHQYVAPAPPCNDNRSLDVLGGDNIAENNFADNTRIRNPCLQLIDQVGSSWHMRLASLLTAANKLQMAPIERLTPKE